MSVRIALNIGPLLRRLGIKESLALPLMERAVPVVNVADASAFTSPLVPPSGWAGFFQPAVAAEFVALEVIARAPGGAFVRDLRVNGAPFTTRFWHFDVGAAPRSPGAAIAVRNMGPISLLATVTGGTVTPRALGDGFPRLLPDDQVGDGFYLAPGTALYVENINSDASSVSVLIQDVLAAETPDAGFPA